MFLVLEDLGDRDHVAAGCALPPLPELLPQRALEEELEAFPDELPMKFIHKGRGGWENLWSHFGLKDKP